MLFKATMVEIMHEYAANYAASAATGNQALGIEALIKLSIHAYRE